MQASRSSPENGGIVHASASGGGDTPITQRLRKKARKLWDKNNKTTPKDKRRGKVVHVIKNRPKSVGRLNFSPASEKAPEVKTESDSDVDSEYMDLNKKEINMEELIKLMNQFHSRTENSVKEMVDTCKSEINSNLDTKVNSLKEEMKQIKCEVKKLESTFEEKIKTVESAMANLDNKIEETATELKSVERVARGEKEGLKEKRKIWSWKLKTIKKTITENWQK